MEMSQKKSFWTLLLDQQKFLLLDKCQLCHILPYFSLQIQFFLLLQFLHFVTITSATVRDDF